MCERERERFGLFFFLKNYEIFHRNDADMFLFSIPPPPLPPFFWNRSICSYSGMEATAMLAIVPTVVASAPKVSVMEEKVLVC